MSWGFESRNPLFWTLSFLTAERYDSRGGSLTVRQSCHFRAILPPRIVPEQVQIPDVQPSQIAVSGSSLTEPRLVSWPVRPERSEHLLSY